MLKFLIDNQLPVALAQFMVERGVIAQHVRDIGLGSGDDAQIANHARQHGLTVISKDEDFVIISNLQGSPTVVWIRLGNCRNAELLRTMERGLPQISTALESGQRIVVVA